MTTHPERDVLIAHADHELAVDEAREVVTHVAGCEECSAVTASLRKDTADFASLLHMLDGAEPEAWHSVTRDASQEVDVLPLWQPSQARPARQGTRQPQHALRWAAGILLTTAAASAAAIAALDMWPRTATVEPAPTAGTAATEQGVATVIALPADGALAVALDNAGAGARLHIEVNDDGDASVAVAGTDAPRFTASAGRVDVVLGSGTSMVRVTVPRTLNRAEVTLDGNVVATISSGTVVPAAAAAPDGMTLEPAVAR